MAVEHEGLPVHGYKPQTQDKVDLANEGKILEERVLRWIEKVGAHDEYDPRMAALGRTNVQQGFMWTIRAIFQPGRIELPEEHDNGPD